MRKSKRRMQFVDHQVQGMLIGRLLLHWTTFIFASVVATIGIEWIGSQANQSFFEIMQSAWLRYAPFAFVAILLLPVFLWDIVRMSNRFAGPMFRLRRVLRQVADGETYTPLTFREGDFWQEIATELNRIAERYDGFREPQRFTQPETFVPEKVAS